MGIDCSVVFYDKSIEEKSNRTYLEELPQKVVILDL